MTKLNIHKVELLGLAVALLVPASSAFGYSYIDLSLGLNGQTSADYSASVGASLDDNASTGSVDSSLDAGASIDANSNSNTDAGSMSGDGPDSSSSNTGVSANSGSSLKLNLGEGNSIRVNRDSVKSNANSSSDSSLDSSLNASANGNPGRISSRDDLEAYASTAISSDPNLKEIVFTDDKVEVSYEQPGRLLALFPVTFEARAITYADGRVEVDYPWYTFLVRDNRSEMESQIKAAVASSIQAQSNADAQSNASSSVMSSDTQAGATFSSQTAAEVARQMKEILSTNLQADVEANLTQESQADSSVR